MSTLFCAISGEVPEEPVISTKTGHIYEKRLIEKYLADNGKCPMSNEAMTTEDLVAVKTSKVVKPRAPTATSIPSMLALFQNEWDATMLETFSLKQQLHQLRQELSHSLYQHEAACRVIARLVQERDSARDALSKLQSAGPVQIQAESMEQESSSAPAAMETEEEESGDGLSQSIKDKLLETSKVLSKGRRKRNTPDDLATPENVQNFKALSSNTALHSASSPGILCLDLHPDQNKIATGGVDKHVNLYDHENESIIHTLKGHTKKVTAVKFHPTENVVFSCSVDKACRIWLPKDDANKGYKTKSIIKVHSDEVVGLSLQATNDYMVSASLDSTWAFWDCRTGATLLHVDSKEVTQGYRSVRFHPDGLLVGTGTVDSAVRIWDVTSKANVATFEGHTGEITSIAFSENGYHLATAENSVVKLWDLRKLSNFKTLTFDEGFNVQTLDFDSTGSYLSIGGNGIKIYNTGKQWEELISLNEESSNPLVTGVKFGENAQSLFSVGMDRSLRKYGVESN